RSRRRETSVGIGTDVLRDPLRPVSIRGLAFGRPPTPAAASRPGVRRAAAAPSIPPAAKPAPESDPPPLATHCARCPSEHWHLVAPPPRPPLPALFPAAPPCRLRSRPPEASVGIATAVLRDPLRPVSIRGLAFGRPPHQQPLRVLECAA